MKKKIIVLSIVLICILACTFAVTAGAEGEGATPTLTIKGYNLNFGESVYITYAVHAENLPAGQTAELLIWNTPPEEYKKGTEDSVICATGDKKKVSGVMCDVYVFDEIVARQMATDFYAVAYVKVGETEYYSVPSKYSVLQYVYNKLGITGTPSTNPDFIELMKVTLKYGASVQKCFDPNNPRRADKTFYQITTVGGTLTDGFKNGLYLEGDTALLTAPAVNSSGASFSHWKNGDGETVSTELSFETDEIYAHATYTACYTATETYTVRFVDYDGTVLRTETVESGNSATAPKSPERKGYAFSGWSGEYSEVTEDVTVTAEYTAEHNQIYFTYVCNDDGTTTVTVSAEGEVNFYGFECKISFEAVGMEYASVSSSVSGLAVNKPSDYIIVSFAASDGYDVTEATDLFTITFTNTADARSIEFSIYDVDIFDDAFEDETYTVKGNAYSA